MEKTNRITLAEIMTSHGVKGLVKVKVYADDETLLHQDGGIFTSPDPDNETDRLSITLKNKHKNDVWLAFIEGITSPEAAKALGRTKLYCNRSSLPPSPKNDSEDGIYVHDLEGLEVRDSKAKEVIGTIISVRNFGASDLLYIRKVSGEDFYHAFTKEAVPHVDLENGYVTIEEPEII